MELVTWFDDLVFSLMKKISCSAMDWVFVFFTKLGDAGFVWLAISLVLIYKKNTRRMGCYMLLCIAAATFVNNVVIKEIADRARPFVKNPEIKLIIDPPSGYSFPSGHTTSSFAAATSIFLFDRKKGGAAYLLALMIGLSRVYLFVHYPTDVLCGMLLGIAGAIIVTKLLQKGEVKLYQKLEGIRKE